MKVGQSGTESKLNGFSGLGHDMVMYIQIHTGVEMIEFVVRSACPILQHPLQRNFNVYNNEIFHDRRYMGKMTLYLWYPKSVSQYQ